MGTAGRGSGGDRMTEKNCSTCKKWDAGISPSFKNLKVRKIVESHCTLTGEYKNGNDMFGCFFWEEKDKEE